MKFFYGFAVLALCWALNAEFSRFFYPYGSYVHQFKQLEKPTIERVVLTSQENEKSEKRIERSAILYRSPIAKANIVISHGFMCDKYDVGFIRSVFPRGKYNFLTFDFRAHGENRDNQQCTFGKDEAYDVQAAALFFKNHPDLKHLPTFAYGFSMGAVATIEAQAKDETLFKGMILDCPFDSTENVIKQAINEAKISFFGYELDLPGKSYLEKYAFHPYVQSFLKTLMKAVAQMDSRNIQTYMERFSPAESVKKIHTPCFFIHCKNDKRVSVDAIYSIFSGAQGPKRLWVTNGRRHYDSLFYNPEKYAKRISQFLDKIINGEIYTEPHELMYTDKNI